MNSALNNRYTQRQQFEKQWHDEKFRDDAYAPPTRRTDNAFRHFWTIVGQPKHLTILDFGCGDGWVSIKLAKQGNTMHAFDLSESLITRARRLAATAEVADRVTFKEMAAENLDYPEASFDLVIGTAILHHTDLEVTLPRIRHVLKPDGRAIFLEPLNQNIVLKIWRALTPWRRTKTERALTREDMCLVRKYFPSTRFRYYTFTSIFAAGVLVFAPNSRILNALHRGLDRLDERVLQSLPSLGPFAAMTIMEMRK